MEQGQERWRRLKAGGREWGRGCCGLGDVGEMDLDSGRWGKDMEMHSSTLFISLLQKLIDYEYEASRTTPCQAAKTPNARN